MINKDLYWPFGISLSLLLFVAFLVGTLLFSRTVPVNLVSDDYYENSLKYQQQLERIQLTRNLSSPPKWRYLPGGQSALLELPANALSPNTVGQITLVRPSDARKDRTLPLQIDKTGRQQVSLAGLDKGLWRVRVIWGEKGTEFYDEQVLVLQ